MLYYVLTEYSFGEQKCTPCRQLFGLVFNTSEQVKQCHIMIYRNRETGKTFSLLSFALWRIYESIITFDFPQLKLGLCSSRSEWTLKKSSLWVNWFASVWGHAYSRATTPCRYRNVLCTFCSPGRSLPHSDWRVEALTVRRYTV